MKVIELLIKLFDMPLMAEIEIDIKHAPNCNISYSIQCIDINKYGDVSMKLDRYDLYSKEKEYKGKRETGIETVPNE